MKQLTLFLVLVMFCFPQLIMEIDDPFLETAQSFKGTVGLRETFIGRNTPNGFQYYNELSPIVSVSFSEHINAYFKHNLIKDKNYYVPVTSGTEPFYTYKDFSGFHSYTEEGFFDFSFSFGEIRLGRFIDQIGESPIDQIVLGSHDYHDGYRVKLTYKSMDFHTRVFQLTPFGKFTNDLKLDNYNRYFYEHGFTWHINSSWSFTALETATQSTVGAQPNFAYINPLSVYYANQTNDRKESNVNIGFLVSYKNKNVKTWAEFYIDDFQIEDEKESALNKEPMEFGFLIGGMYTQNKHSFYLNITGLTNRTYNDLNGVENSEISVTKYIDHDKVIGYSAGSNLIHTDAIYKFDYTNDLQFSYRIRYFLNGNEAVFSVFDTSYLNDGHQEKFPHGDLSRSFSNLLSLKYRINNYYIYASASLERTTSWETSVQVAITKTFQLL